MTPLFPALREAVETAMDHAHARCPRRQTLDWADCCGSDLYLELQLLDAIEPLVQAARRWYAWQPRAERYSAKYGSDWLPELLHEHRQLLQDLHDATEALERALQHAKP